MTLALTDVDGDTVTYSVTAQDPSMVTLSVTDNIVTFKSIVGKSGKTDVNITASDYEYSVSKLFTLQILSLEDGDNVEEEGEVSVISDENSTKTIVTVAADNLTLSIQEDANGSVSHEIDGTKTLATSNINGSTVEVTPNGVSTAYEDSDLSLEVNATLRGEATHKLITNGKTTQASSAIRGAHTIINKDINGAIQIQTSVVYDTNTTISVTAKADGSAEHSVLKNGKTSKATSTVVGANTLITASGDVQTSAGEVNDTNGYVIKAEVVTSAEGKSITRFIRVNATDETDSEIIRNTLKETTPFEAGNESVIEEINGLLYIKTNAPLNGNLIIE